MPEPRRALTSPACDPAEPRTLVGPFPATRMRLTGLMAAGACAADWTVKSMHPGVFAHWYGHEATVPLSDLMVIWLMALLAVWLIAHRLTTAGAGLFAGGSTANVLDVMRDGQAWNMIHMPGSGDRWCNVADICICAGMLLFCVGVLAVLAGMVSRTGRTAS